MEPVAPIGVRPPGGAVPVGPAELVEPATRRRERDEPDHRRRRRPAPPPEEPAVADADGHIDVSA